MVHNDRELRRLKLETVSQGDPQSTKALIRNQRETGAQSHDGG